MKRIAELDGLRAVAVVMVLLWHYIGVPGGGALYTLFRPGRAGVDLFFVLSGFLITSTLIGTRGREGYFINFYARRALRILPLYVLMVSVLAAGRATGSSVSLFGGEYSMWAYATFTQNFEAVRLGGYGAPWLGVSWSLAVEEQFYLLFPLLIAFADPKRLPRYLLAILIAAPLLRVASYPFSDWAYYVLMPCRADSLAGGAIIAWALSNARTIRWLQERRAAISRIALGLLSIAPLLWVIPDRHLSLHMVLWGHTCLTALFATVLMVCVLYAGHPSLWLLRTKAAAGLAAISYAVYLVHPAVLALLAGGGRATLAHVPAALAITFVVCIASYFLIERPSIRMGSQLGAA